MCAKLRSFAEIAGLMLIKNCGMCELVVYIIIKNIEINKIYAWL